MRDLLRPCLGCGRSVRGKPRCVDCERARERAKAAKRQTSTSDLHLDHRERQRRARVVAEHRAMLSDWCPGWWFAAGRATAPDPPTSPAES
jgi:hypothetical protein